MEKTPVIAVFDIGKTNKKLLLFDRAYRIVYERSGNLKEVKDEDGDPCEDIGSLKNFLYEQLQEVTRNGGFDIKALNFSAYGASMVFLDEQGQPVTPLYNYLKPYPESLKKQFYGTYGGEEGFAFRTASPVLGSLNSGMQIYRLKYGKPELFKKVKLILHLPQYLSFLFTGDAVSDITSVGCHTNLWDFQKSDYHEWVKKEGVLEKLAPLKPADKAKTANFSGKDLKMGIGLHDSSAALIPYLASFEEPFVLISTGTWCISLNPFNKTLLTAEELANDCLSYLQYNGNPVKAARLFAGYEHEQEVKRIADHFNLEEDYYQSIPYDKEILARLPGSKSFPFYDKQKEFSKIALSDFSTFEEAYHWLMACLVQKQVYSTRLVIKGSNIKKLFVDGGFSKNPIYMNLLAAAFPQLEIYAASMAQATALGAALAIHSSWNPSSIPNDIIDLKHFATEKK